MSKLLKYPQIYCTNLEMKRPEWISYQNLTVRGGEYRFNSC